MYIYIYIYTHYIYIMYIYIYTLYTYTLYIYIYIMYAHICLLVLEKLRTTFERGTRRGLGGAAGSRSEGDATPNPPTNIVPILTLFDSNFPGNPLWT